jgi:CRISPR-associated endonuclease Csn1
MQYHQPICKVRVAETLGNKFQVGNTGNKINKYVESDKGTNLFFAIYQDVMRANGPLRQFL